MNVRNPEEKEITGRYCQSYSVWCQNLPKTITKVILMVFTLALGMRPLELARLHSGSLSRAIFLLLASVSGTRKNCSWWYQLTTTIGSFACIIPPHFRMVLEDQSSDEFIEIVQPFLLCLVRAMSHCIRKYHYRSKNFLSNEVCNGIFM